MNDSIATEMKAREHHFHTQFHLEPYFGALEEPKFEKEFELKYIGHPTVLPRGQQVNSHSKDPAFFKSVHLGGEKIQELLEQSLKEEKALWESKVVVETKDFKMSGFKIRDKPLQMDRAKDILKDPPKKQALKQLYAKDYEPSPLSIMLQEPYVPPPNAASNTLGREYNPDKFITAKLTKKNLLESTSGNNSNHHGGKASTKEAKPEDFHRYLNPDKNGHNLLAHISKKKHPPLDKSQYSGPRWDPVS
jgi:hypothetical protein